MHTLPCLPPPCLTEKKPQKPAVRVQASSSRTAPSLASSSVRRERPGSPPLPWPESFIGLLQAAAWARVSHS